MAPTTSRISTRENCRESPVSRGRAHQMMWLLVIPLTTEVVGECRIDEWQWRKAFAENQRKALKK
jgi:hypothetical protein